MNGRWKSLFKPLILERGWDYYRDGCVVNLDRKADSIQAEVMGSEDYEVDIYLANEKSIGMECSCPYAAGGENCKHMAAVLYAVELDFNDNKSTPAVEHDTTVWMEAISSLPEETLRDLLKEWASSDTELQERLVLLHTGKPQEKSILDWKTELMEMVWEVADRDDFVDYQDAYGLMTDMVDYMLRRLTPLMECGAIMDAFHLVDTVYVTAMGVEMDDSDGGLYMLTSNCADAWRTIFEAASEDQRQEMHKLFWLNRECNGSEIGADELEEIFLNLPWSETLQKQNLERLDLAIQLCKKSDYHLSVYLSFRETIMRRLGADDKDVITFWEQHATIPEARDRLLELYMHSDKEAAIELLLECKKIDKDATYKLIGHSQKLIVLYHECGQKEQYENELRFLVLGCKYIRMPYLQQLKEITEPAQWREIFERLLAFSKAWYDRFTLLSLEKRYQTMLEDIQKAGNIHWLNEYEPELLQWSAEQTRDCLIAVLKREMQHATSRKQYWTVIQHLKKLKTYPKGIEATEALVQYWCEQHSNRPAMKDELRKARYI